MPSRVPTLADWPADWDDHPAWNRWYAHLDSRIRLQALLADKSRMVLGAAAARGDIRRVWFPGCGVALGPHLWASAGYQVLASDVSEAAIECQREYLHSLRTQTTTPETALLQRQLGAHAELALTFAIHDFRQPIDAEPFDAIVNVDALAGLQGDSLQRAAATFHRRLREGGVAWFITSGMPQAVAGQVEGALTTAGFHVPMATSNAWLRTALASSDAQMVFGRLTSGTLGQAALQSLQAEYDQRLQADSKETLGRQQDGVTRVAWVLSSTG